MTHDVFISHSSKDKVIANAVCSALENTKIRCWITPRDIFPGEKWAAAITNSIANSKIMVLIFSSNSNNSDDVLNEILLAKNADAIIIPFKIENILPEGEMKYYLARTHWLDAMDPPTEKHIQLLVETIKLFIKGSSSISTPDLTVLVETVALEPQREIERKQREKEEKDRQPREEKELNKRELIPKTYTSKIGMKFILIPAGEFMMGSEETKYEKPVHKVTISKQFYLGVYPVTQNEWKSVMGNNPSRFNGEHLPVENVSWNDVQEFIKQLNKKEGTSKYSLPSEAECEYAARAGTTTRYSFGDNDSKLGEYAWYYENSLNQTHEVGQKKPNPWGLYDMHGNVWEWVQDEWHKDYIGAPTDGSSWEDGNDSGRVYRGGGWRGSVSGCRSSDRDDEFPGDCRSNLGFRVLRIL